MVRSVRVPGALASVAAALLTGCGLIAGLGDYSPGEAKDGGVDSSAGSDANGRDGSREGAVDAGPSDAPPLPACGDASHCVPEIPDGSSLYYVVAIDAGTAPCSAEGHAVTVYEAPGTVFCGSCACGPSDAGCEVNVYTSMDQDCGASTSSFAATTSCLSPGFSFSSFDFEVAPVESSSSGCLPSVAGAVPSMPRSTSAFLCAESPGTSDGCSGSSCEPIPPSPYEPNVVCVTPVSDQPCSGSFPVAYAYVDAGMALCTAGSCACGSAGGSCGDYILTAYYTNDCTGTSLTVTSGSTCLGSSPPFSALSATSDGASPWTCPPLGSPPEPAPRTKLCCNAGLF